MILLLIIIIIRSKIIIATIIKMVMIMVMITHSALKLSNNNINNNNNNNTICWKCDLNVFISQSSKKNVKLWTVNSQRLHLISNLAACLVLFCIRYTLNS